MIIKLSPFILTIGKVLTYVAFVWYWLFSPLYLAFLADHPITDSLGLVRMSKNPHLNICNEKDGLCKEGSSNNQKILVNIALLLSFWVHHVLFSHQKVKSFMITVWPEYIAIERAVFNIMAMLTLTLHLIFWQPLTSMSFEFNELVFRPISILMTILATFINLVATFSMFHADLFGVSFIRRACENGGVELQSKSVVIHPWMYQVCRHPMMLSALIYYLFTGLKWNLGRFLYTFIYAGGSLLGVYFEERHLEQYEEYRDYQSKVKNRVWPDFRVLFGGKRIYDK
jgi:protein-S-isoprenylcysteine O-methyltransferase Ste14